MQSLFIGLGLGVSGAVCAASMIYAYDPDKPLEKKDMVCCAVSWLVFGMLLEAALVKFY